MARRMLINAQRPEELRIAVVNGDILEDYQVAIAQAGLTRGNIYRGVVSSVQPSLDAAFVNYGAERDGLVRAHDVVRQAWHRTPAEESRRPRIDRILEKGGPILVQVTKDPSGSKGAALTTNISLAGRHLVLMPYDDVHGISRRVEDEEERRALKEAAEKLAAPEGFGYIIRTNAIGQSKTALNRDLNALLRLWKRIRSEANQGKGPRLLYSDQDLIIQAVRDMLSPDIEEVVVDSDEAFERVQAAMRAFMPRSKTRVIRYRERMPLFSRYNLEDQLERIFQPRVELPSGGSIVIEGTEALTAIDVNSGRSTRGGSQSETAFKTNLEAIAEVARQLRLRDIGGLVVVDLIDMDSPKHRKTIEKAMRDALKADRARVSVGRISPNGLLEINRQRLKTPLVLRTHRLCPTCGGGGRIPSPETVSLNLLRRIEERAATRGLKGVRVRLHPELADFLQNTYRKELADLEAGYEITIEVVAAPGLHRSEEDISWVKQTRQADSSQAAEPEQPAVQVTDLTTGGGPAAAASQPQERQPAGETAEPAVGTTDTPSKRRRRGGRRHKKTADAPIGGDGEPATSAEPPEPRGTSDRPEQPAQAEASPRKENLQADRPRSSSSRRRRRRKPGASTEDSTARKTEKGGSGGQAPREAEAEKAGAAPDGGGGQEKETGSSSRRRRRGGRRRKKPTVDNGGASPERKENAPASQPRPAEEQRAERPEGPAEGAAGGGGSTDTNPRNEETTATDGVRRLFSRLFGEE
ncbi:MAG: Rne/Rng family ribonuclease [Acidobacteria bacterium]|nr:Rne/Rng family ribonuclease [Acidobacteriota bacterium]